ncbi:MAG TPA: hypothetical protein VLY83_03755 [Methanoregula sp.]|nr:hypothetical protein [Methanoregula sp.]
MKEVGEIRYLNVEGEFRVCPECGYTRGFHASFLDLSPGKDYPVKSTKRVFRVILVCPDCGSRFDIGWKIPLDEGAPSFVALPGPKK